MRYKNDIVLSASEIFSALLIEKGITTWGKAITYIQNVSYGRTENREDLTLVITQEKGTCSSKHAVLKCIADENNIPNISLIIGMYKMTKENTPGIGNYISKCGLPYIPEAHCYLKINGNRMDVTNPTSSISRIANVILEEKEVAPHQVSKWKVAYHKRYIQDWKISEAIQISFDEIWKTRELCIASLSGSL